MNNFYNGIAKLLIDCSSDIKNNNKVTHKNDEPDSLQLSATFKRGTIRRNSFRCYSNTLNCIFRLTFYSFPSFERIFYWACLFYIQCHAGWPECKRG